MNEALTAAIHLYEVETGCRLTDDLPNETDEAIIELFLILHGFGPERVKRRTEELP